MASSFEITITNGCTNDRQFSPLDAAGNGVNVDPTDVIRFKLGRGDGVTPLLDLRSDQVTANKSGLTVNQTTPLAVTLRLAQGDLTLTPGIYRAHLGIVDDSETAPADAFKPVSTGVVYVIGMLGGPVDKA